MTEQFARYLADFAAERISLAEFQDWLIDYVMGPEAMDPADVSAAHDVENALAEFSGGHISEAQFRDVVKQYVGNLTIVSALPGFVLQAPKTYSVSRTLRTELLVANW